MNIFRKIYGLVPGMKNDIIKLWVDRMNKIQVKESFGDYIRIVEVDVPSETLQHVPAHLKADGAFNREAGQLLETFLSSTASAQSKVSTMAKAVWLCVPVRFGCVSFGSQDRKCAAAVSSNGRIASRHRRASSSSCR